MSHRVEHTAFDGCHPAVGAVYAVITLALTMFSLQPVLIALSCAGGFCYACCVRGPGEALRSLRWQLPLLVVVALLNPFFSASGSTEIARIGGRAIYLESLCYGCAMAGLFVACTLWFRGACSMVPFDRAMTLLGSAAPVLALMVCQCMRLIPRFVRQGRQVAAVADVARPPAAGARERLRARLRLSHVLMGWTLEDSLETADAMRARAWGAARRRTSYTRYRFTPADGLRLVVIGLAGALVFALAVEAVGRFSFYPTLSPLAPWWGYGAYAAWMAVPALLHLREGLMFR